MCKPAHDSFDYLSLLCIHNSHFQYKLSICLWCSILYFFPHSVSMGHSIPVSQVLYLCPIFGWNRVNFLPSRLYASWNQDNLPTNCVASLWVLLVDSGTRSFQVALCYEESIFLLLFLKCFLLRLQFPWALIMCTLSCWLVLEIVFEEKLN